VSMPIDDRKALSVSDCLPTLPSLLQALIPAAPCGVSAWKG